MDRTISNPARLEPPDETSAQTLAEVIGPFLPLRIEGTEVGNGFIILSGPDWNAEIATSWRLNKLPYGIVASHEHEEEGEGRAGRDQAARMYLPGRSIIRAVQPPEGLPRDMIFDLDDGSRLWIFAHQQYCAWTMNLPDGSQINFLTEDH